MALDRVKPLKIESIDTGGDTDDLYPTSLDPQEDYVEVAGVVFDDATHVDESTVIDRLGNDMRFRDGNNPGGATLSELVAGTGGLTADGHKVLRQLIHFIDEGPTEGFASGAYKETLPSAAIFPTSIIWWESSSKLKKIVERTLTWTGPNLTTSVWEVYDTDGSTVLATITDTISYTGVFETTRTRTIA